jgi:REP element-mobilizing transposase RayT
VRGRGGKREGAGRKPKGARAGVSHRARPPLASRFPVHAGLKVARDLPSLRSRKTAKTIERAFWAGCRREGFRLAHFSIQKRHLHLLVEAKDAQSLSRGMQGLAIRVARALNKHLGRRGKVFVDRYFSRILRTPSETRNCLCYVLNNARRHEVERDRCGKIVARRWREPGWVDPCSSGRYFDGWSGDVRSRSPDEAAPVAPPGTWLLSVGWLRARGGRIAVDEVPRGEPRTWGR